jgi:hypothetical protein
MMHKEDLVEKFKLAAKLNGIEWDDLAVTGLTLVQVVLSHLRQP